jgi:hypothetical protein
MSTPFRIHGYPKPPLVAGVDLSTNQFCFVKAGSGEGQAAPITAATDRPIAVQVDRPRAGEAGEFVAFGIVELEAGGAINYGQEIGLDAQGRAIPAAPSGYICGYALSAASGEGERISAFVNLVNPPRRTQPA